MVFQEATTKSKKCPVTTTTTLPRNNTFLIEGFEIVFLLYILYGEELKMVITDEQIFNYLQASKDSDWKWFCLFTILSNLRFQSGRVETFLATYREQLQRIVTPFANKLDWKSFFGRWAMIDLTLLGMLLQQDQTRMQSVFDTFKESFEKEPELEADDPKWEAVKDEFSDIEILSMPAPTS